MYEKLKSILVNDLHLMEADLRPDALHQEIGLDSLAIVELSLILKKQLGIDISDDELLEAPTVADIADLIAQRMPRPVTQAIG